MPLVEPIPDLLSLDLLVSVARLGSMSAAAAEHGMTQPAVSMRLRGLEQTLGIQLLERRSTGSRITPAGEAAVEWATVALDAVTDLVTGVAAIRGAERTHLRVAASMTVAEYLFPGWLTRLDAAIPGVRTALVMGNSAEVARRVLDDVELGFVEGPTLPPGLSSRTVRTDRVVIIVDPTHPWAGRRRPLDPELLAATPLVLREEGSGTREILDRVLATHGLAPTVAVELASTTAIKAAVMAGAGPAVVSELALDRERSTGQVVVVPCDDLDTTRPIRAIWPATRTLRDPAATLVRLATEETGDDGRSAPADGGGDHPDRTGGDQIDQTRDHGTGSVDRR